MSSKTLYLQLNKVTEVYQKDIFLKDVADLYCEDASILAKCKALKVRSIQTERDKRYVGHVMDIIQKITEMDSSIQVNSIGETEFVIDYCKNTAHNKFLEWMKTILICFISFFGAGFAIMTFNNDAATADIFSAFYEAVMGHPSDGFTILEVTYSIGMVFGILGFFNHFSKVKFTTDPTPLEVEMRLYEDNVNKTLIQNEGRKESGIDVS